MFKTKTAKKIIKDKGLSEMLGQMLGEGPLNINITFSKYIKIHDTLEKLIALFRLLSTSVLFNSDEGGDTIQQEIKLATAEIKKFVVSAEVEMRDLFPKDLIRRISTSVVDLNLIPAEMRQEFEKKYEMMKESPVIDMFLTVCNELARFKRDLDDVNNLSDRFIIDMPGVEFRPFPFTSLNLKVVFNMLTAAPGFDEYSEDIANSAADKKSSSSEEKIRRFLLLFLNKVYLVSYELYKVYSEPDVDIDEFVNVISDSIKEVRKHIPRCDKAFNKILKSVKMLKDNFGVYYKDFLASKSSSIIMENFILDIAKGTNADAELTMQFRKIINYYKDMAKRQGKTNEKLNFLFEQANEHLSKLDKYNNLGKNGTVSREEEAVNQEETEEEICLAEGRNLSNVEVRIEDKNDL